MAVRQWVADWPRGEKRLVASPPVCQLVAPAEHRELDQSGGLAGIGGESLPVCGNPRFHEAEAILLFKKSISEHWVAPGRRLRTVVLPLPPAETSAAERSERGQFIGQTGRDHSFFSSAPPSTLLFLDSPFSSSCFSSFFSTCSFLLASFLD